MLGHLAGELSSRRMQPNFGQLSLDLAALAACLKNHLQSKTPIVCFQQKFAFPGLVQINNWKPIPFESITDNQDELVSNLFKEISNNVTLKILTKQSVRVCTQKARTQRSPSFEILMCSARVRRVRRDCTD